MKKTLSFFLALCLVLSMSFTAFAGEKAKAERIEEQIEGAVEYLTEGVSAYGVDDAVDFYTLVHSGADLSAYSDGFLADVKANLDTNDGKIISSYGESLATYGAVILILGELGEDPYDFYGYDIVSAFEAMNPESYIHPYYYRIALPAAVYYCDDEVFINALCDYFVDTYYVMGQGMDLGGYFCCDNTAYFITALSCCAYNYAEVMRDAFTVLDSYKADGGYFCDSYSPEANADSTGLALMAYSSVVFYVEDEELEDYFEKTGEIYDDLCTFEGTGTGIFISSYTDEDDLYATKDALMGLEEYYFVAYLEELYNEENQSTTTTTTTATVKNETTDNTSKKDTSKKSPATGANTRAIAIAVACAGLGVLALARKKNS